MDVKQAKDLVFERVCREYKERGDDARVYWRALPDELEIPPEIFQGAMESFVEAGGGIEVGLDDDYDYIKLGPGGVGRCTDS